MHLPTQEVECDILVVGGGLGGCAAALRAARLGYRVCLTEETPWLGGQCTSQGVSALDEHQYIESCGATSLYYEFREGIRDHYRNRYPLSRKAETAPFFNPGDGWVSRLCFEPRAGLAALRRMLEPQVEAGRLRIYPNAWPIGARRDGTTITSVTVAQPGRQRRLRFRAAFYLDATELGDLLPMLGLPYASGAESRDRTGEPDARADGPDPALVQTFTFPFAVDFRPGQDHTIPRPPGYEHNRDHQPYTLTLRYGERDLTYKIFEDVTDLPGSFWTYRRLVAADQFAPGEVEGDLAMINWAGNDFKGGNIIDAAPAERADLLRKAKELSLGLLYWLQTEVPRDDGQGRGYPEMRLRPDVMGTADGLSQYPYIRESRRILARRTVLEQDVLARLRTGARAEPFADSVGIGHYPMDIHGVPGDVAATGPTLPFQVPLGALLPADADNLLPACKNLGVTHMTNGCYRLQPIEWNIGEAAGALAAFCLGRAVKPGAVLDDADLLRAFQRQLLDTGVPLYWYDDLPQGHPAFAAGQLLALEGLWPGAEDHLHFEPERLLGAEEANALLREAGLSADRVDPVTRADLARAVAERRFAIDPRPLRTGSG